MIQWQPHTGGHRYRFGPIHGMTWNGHGFWVRVWLNGWGLHVDRHQPGDLMIFSERYGYNKKMHISVWPHQTIMCLGILTPGNRRKHG